MALNGSLLEIWLVEKVGYILIYSSYYQNTVNLLNEQAPVTMEFLRKHTDNGVMEPLKLMNR